MYIYLFPRRTIDTWQGSKTGLFRARHDYYGPNVYIIFSIFTAWRNFLETRSFPSSHQRGCIVHRGPLNFTHFQTLRQTHQGLHHLRLRP